MEFTTNKVTQNIYKPLHFFIMAYCENCGNQLSETAKFCSHCGAKMTTYNDDNEKNEISNPNKNRESGNSGGFLKSLFWIGIIIGGIYFIYNSRNKSSVSSNYNDFTNQNIEAVVDPNAVDTPTINSQDPPVQDAAGILNSQYADNNQNNSNSSTDDISAQDVENVISKGLDIISYLGKSNEWESHTFPFRCIKCGETCTASGVYKERTDEFVPYKDEFPTRWFHTHNWERLK